MKKCVTTDTKDVCLVSIKKMLYLIGLSRLKISGSRKTRTGKIDGNWKRKQPNGCSSCPWHQDEIRILRFPQIFKTKSSSQLSDKQRTFTRLPVSRLVVRKGAMTQTRRNLRCLNVTPTITLRPNLQGV